jgi:hypothetical protein
MRSPVELIAACRIGRAAVRDEAVKVGASYTAGGRFFMPCDDRHYEETGMVGLLR